jgi:hypothetical protein
MKKLEDNEKMAKVPHMFKNNASLVRGYKFSTLLLPAFNEFQSINTAYFLTERQVF